MGPVSMAGGFAGQVKMRFAETIEQVELNARNLHDLTAGSPKERAFHRTRVANALHHVVVDGEEGVIFAPAKWCGAASNDMDSYFGNKDPVTDHFRRVLRRIGYRQISPGHAEHQRYYDEFSAYCARFGFTHSKPPVGDRHYHVLVDSERNLYPDELPEDSTSFWEGTKKTSIVNRYERDSRARKSCIASKGASCVVCEFNFGQAYGDLGAGFIHVHHIVPLAEIAESYRVNPETDLEPVCPNCHAMLHKEIPPLSIEKLRSIIREYR